MLDYIEFYPKTEKKATIIWLHGLGADYHDFFPLAEPLQLAGFPIHFIFPNAPIRPVHINGNYPMRAWYDIVSSELAREIDLAGIKDSTAAIIEIIEYQKKLNPNTPIFLAGFSQGAVIAMLTALKYPGELKGIIALSGYLPNHDFPHPSNQRNFFLSHGKLDAIVPFKSGEHAMQTLKNLNQTVLWHTNRREHTVDLETIAEIKKWLEEIMQHE